MKRALILVALLLAGCGREPGTTVITKGALTVECDDAVVPVMRQQIDEFQRQYTDARLTLRPAEAREAVVDFAHDSVGVIVIARQLDKEEHDALTDAKIQYQEYRVAMSAVAVIVNKKNPLTQLRMGELDSVFSGGVTRWTGAMRKYPIDLVIGGINSSTNAVFRRVALKGGPFALSATMMDSTGALIAYVAKTPNAIGIVGLNWLENSGDRVRVVALGIPGTRPDSTEPVGKYYLPEQYYVYKEYYPLSTPVYVYDREASIGLGYGFISYVSSLPGQRTFQKSNLVPVTLPVRWVQTTSRPLPTSSEQVK